MSALFLNHRGASGVMSFTGELRRLNPIGEKTDSRVALIPVLLDSQK